MNLSGLTTGSEGGTRVSGDARRLREIRFFSNGHHRRRRRRRGKKKKKRRSVYLYICRLAIKLNVHASFFPRAASGRNKYENDLFIYYLCNS